MKKQTGQGRGHSLGGDKDLILSGSQDGCGLLCLVLPVSGAAAWHCVRKGLLSRFVSSSFLPLCSFSCGTLPNSIQGTGILGIFALFGRLGRVLLLLSGISKTGRFCLLPPTMAAPASLSLTLLVLLYCVCTACLPPLPCLFAAPYHFFLLFAHTFTHIYSQW